MRPNTSATILSDRSTDDQFAALAAEFEAIAAYQLGAEGKLLQKPVLDLAMTYDGIADAGERADLLAYLKQANGSAECRKH